MLAPGFCFFSRYSFKITAAAIASTVARSACFFFRTFACPCANVRRRRREKFFPPVLPAIAPLPSSSIARPPSPPAIQVASARARRIASLPPPSRRASHRAAAASPTTISFTACSRDKFPQPPHVFIAIHALERRQRTRQRRFDVRQRQPDAYCSVVDRQNRRPANRRNGRVFRGLLSEVLTCQLYPRVRHQPTPRLSANRGRLALNPCGRAGPFRQHFPQCLLLFHLLVEASVL